MDVYTVILQLRAGFVRGKEKTCGKTNYSTESLAKSIATYQSKKQDEKREAYPCIFCGYWHIGKEINYSELEDLAECFDYII